MANQRYWKKKHEHACEKAVFEMGASFVFVDQMMILKWLWDDVLLFFRTNNDLYMKQTKYNMSALQTQLALGPSNSIVINEL